MSLNEVRDFCLVVIPVCVAILVPVVLHAGSLEPAGPPAATMMTLDEVPPTWSQILPGSERFVEVLEDDFLAVGDEAILDKETGLVWERAPSEELLVWEAAVTHCATRETGGRMGWQVPSVEQLASLIDRSNSPALPSDHPFTRPAYIFWTATTYISDPSRNWGGRFSDGELIGVLRAIPTGYRVWCVRSGSNYMAE